MQMIQLLKYLVLIFISIVTLMTIVYLSGEYQPARYYAELCDDKNAVSDGDWQYEYDGFYIGNKGCLYNPKSTNIADVPTVITYTESSDEEPIREAIWYVNGIDHRIDWTLLEMELLSQKAERPVIGIYNATRGGRIPDTLKKIDKSSAVAKTLSAAIAQQSAQGHEIFIRANSQGAVHTSFALKKALDALAIAFKDENFKRIGNNIHVETGAATTDLFPAGPKYLHYVNVYDPIPERSGILSNQSGPFAPLTTDPNTVIARFADKDTNPIESKYHWLGPMSKRFNRVHGFNIYLKYRQPFKQLHDQGKEQAGEIIKIP